MKNYKCERINSLNAENIKAKDKKATKYGEILACFIMGLIASFCLLATTKIIADALIN